MKSLWWLCGLSRVEMTYYGCTILAVFQWLSCTIEYLSPPSISPLIVKNPTKWLEYMQQKVYTKLMPIFIAVSSPNVLSALYISHECHRWNPCRLGVSLFLKAYMSWERNKSIVMHRYVLYTSLVPGYKNVIPF